MDEEDEEEEEKKEEEKKKEEPVGKRTRTQQKKKERDSSAIMGALKGAVNALGVKIRSDVAPRSIIRNLGEGKVITGLMVGAMGNLGAKAMLS